MILVTIRKHGEVISTRTCPDNSTTVIGPDLDGLVITVAHTWPAPLPPPQEPAPPNLAFLAHVLSWVRDELDEDAAEVTGVTSYGTDWAGDTNGGFHSEHDVTVTWRNADGTEHRRELAGESLIRLWDHVVNHWPGDRNG